MNRTSTPIGRRRRRSAVAVVAASALVLAACGGDDDDDAASDVTAADDSETTEAAADDAADDTSETTEAPADDGETTEAPADDTGGETFSIAIVAPSAANDQAFTQSMVDSIDTIAATGDYDVAISDGLFVVEDAAAAIRGYAEEGYDLVIAHGSQYGAPLEEIAPDFPEVAFAWGTSVDNFGLDNVYAYTAAADQGGYVNGTIAAELTESGTIGVVGPIDVGDAALYVDGFEAGAVATDPDVTVNVNFIESFSDVALAAEAATSHVSNGADVLTGTAQMVVGATGVATTEGIPWFGTQANQTELAPDIVVTSQVYHWEVAVEPLIDAIKAGEAGTGEAFVATLENGGLVMEYNDAFGLDAEIQAAAEDTAAQIASGELSTGVG